MIFFFKFFEKIFKRGWLLFVPGNFGDNAEHKAIRRHKLTTLSFNQAVKVVLKALDHSNSRL